MTIANLWGFLSVKSKPQGGVAMEQKGVRVNEKESITVEEGKQVLCFSFPAKSQLCPSMSSVGWRKDAATDKDERGALREQDKRE